MVVAMPIVLVVEMTVHEVVDVVAVRDGFMAAAGAVDMVGGVCGAGVTGGAGGRILIGHIEGVLVVVAFVRVVEMAVVQVVHMVAMKDGGVAATGAVLMGMIGMNVMSHNFFAFLGG